MAAIPEAQVLHHIPGRLRLKIPRLREQPALADSLSQELREREDVLEVTVRPVTGNVLLRYQPNGVQPEAFLQSLASVVRVAEPRPAVTREAPAGTVGEVAAAWTHERWNRLNQGLKRATDGAVDLGTVVPLFFLFLAVRQILTQPVLHAMPWYVALSLAYSAFEHYHGHAERRGVRRRADADSGD